MSVKLKLITALFFIALVSACDKDDSDDTNFTMDDVARIEEIKLPYDQVDNDTTIYILNEYGKIDTAIWAGYGNTEARYTVYTYDANGNVISSEDFNGEGKYSEEHNYQDNLLVEIETTFQEEGGGTFINVDSFFWSNGVLDSLYEYDPQDQLSEKKYYAYDSDGNMIQRVCHTIEDGVVSKKDTTTFREFFFDYIDLVDNHTILTTGISRYKPKKFYFSYTYFSYVLNEGVFEYENNGGIVSRYFERNENGLLGKITERDLGRGTTEILYNYTFK